ncbi:hypothetical protein C3942_10200 [Solimonas fluminis]|uniref:DUF4124 domain-containing protein n=1 Tax=Solimonas fluminis TaxID=2086571 RepID=A0A2S5TFM4_9GAMM|nr:hypothetical protein [Solimonas fluminis]PPE73775.1 hypothetical protein C3942_10200 [Solimonas fluminis]
MVKSWVTAGVLATLAACIGGYAEPAEAAFYKCRDAKGEIYFTDKGCAPRNPGAERPSAGDAPVVAPPPAAEPAAPPPAPAAEPPLPPSAPPAPQPPVAVPVSPQFQPARPSSYIEPLAPPGSGARGEAGALTGTERAAGAPAEPLRPRKVESVRWWAVGLGLFLLMVTHAWMIVIAFRAGSTAWGVALIVGSPVSNLAYLLTHFRKAGWPSLVGIAALASLAYVYVPPVDLIEMSDSYLTTRGSTDLGDRKPRIIFTRKETICLKSIIRWDGMLEDWWVGRNQQVSWAWYTDGQLQSDHQVKIDFDRTPFVLLGYMPGSELGRGKHRVELRINGELFDSRDFEVK